MASFKDIVNSKVFTFLIGPDQTTVNVSITALGSISEPLENLMTNSGMLEAGEEKAVIGDVEPATFIALVEYAYKGVSGTIHGLGAPRTWNPQYAHRCLHCGTTVNQPTLTTYPFCAQLCKDTAMEALRTTYLNHTQFCVYMSLRCVAVECSKNVYGEPGKLLCDKHSTPQIQEMYPSVEFNDSLTNYNVGGVSSSLVKFYERKYTCAGVDTTALNRQAEIHQVKKPQKAKILADAKLYVLADRYLVEPLKDLCLYKIHRNMCSLNPEDDSDLDVVIDTISYTYANTADGGDAIDGSIDRLRDLLINYAAKNAQRMVKHVAFRRILVEGGAATADFVTLMLNEYA